MERIKKEKPQQFRFSPLVKQSLDALCVEDQCTNTFMLETLVLKEFRTRKMMSSVFLGDTSNLEKEK